MQDRREPCGPGALGVRGRDEILPQFDQDVRAAGAEGVAVDGVAGQVAAVGLVVADREIALGAQARDQRQGKAAVEVAVQDADLPGPRRAPGELRRKGVHRDDHGIGAAPGKGGIGGVIGPVQPVEPFFAHRRVRVAVAGDDRAVIEAHEERRVVLAPVRVDHQPREPARDDGAVERRSQRLGDAERADVVGDVARHLGPWQAERRPGGRRDPVRHDVGGVIAGDQPASPPFLTCDGKGRVVHVVLPHPSAP